MRIARFALLLSVVGGLAAAPRPVAAQQFESVPEAQPEAQEQQGLAAEAFRVGVLNVQAAMVNTQEGQKAAEDLQNRFNPRRAELEKLQREVRDLESQLRTQERTLSDEARMNLLRDLERKRKQASRLEEDLRDEVEDARADYINRIGEKMQRVIDQYARENELDVVLNAFQGGPIIWRTPTVDITQDIIQLYDQTYPVEATTGANQPSSNPSNQPR